MCGNEGTIWRLFASSVDFKWGRISQKYRFSNFFWGLEKKGLGKMPWALLWKGDLAHF